MRRTAAARSGSLTASARTTASSGPRRVRNSASRSGKDTGSPPGLVVMSQYQSASRTGVCSSANSASAPDNPHNPATAAAPE